MTVKFTTLRHVINVDCKKNWRQDRTLSHTKLDIDIDIDDITIC